MTETAVNFQELIEEKQWKKLRDEIIQLDPYLIAEVIEELSDEDDIIVFRLLPRDLAKDTFQHLNHDKQEEIIEGLAQNVSKLSSLLNDLDPDDRTAFFEELPGQITMRLIQLLRPEERTVATKLLGFPKDSIGRLMTPEYVAVKPHYTVQEALEHIRRYGRDSETLNVIYIVDNDWRLVDDIRIREVLLATPDQQISELMDNRYVALNAFDDQEVAIRVFQDQDRVALPVTDNDGLLLGIVTFDDMMDVAEEENTEDFHKFGAFQDAIVNPLKAKITLLYKMRVFWLTALVFMNIPSGSIIESFEATLLQVGGLLLFLPLIIASGGNAGAQSATLMIRSLATGDVESKDWFILVGKEFLVSLMLGVTMAIGVSLIASVRAPEIVLVVVSSMVLTVVAGSVLGLMLPFIFTRLKLDPAAASAPLITSMADITGVLIYLSIATWYFAI